MRSGYTLWLLLSLLVLCCLADDAADDDGTYYNQFSVCSDSAIVVKDLSLMCNSPGAYYYGSNKYRNSASCQAGDKAYLKVTLYIANNMQQDDGSYATPYINLKVKGYGTVADEQIYQGEELCDTGNIKSTSGSSCPGVGEYIISTHFYWGDQSDEYEYSFKPKVIVGLHSDPSQQYYDLGGANTDLCAGDTFINWTTGVRKSAANTIHTFIVTFGILCASIVAVFATGWYIMRQANKRSTSPNATKLMEDEEDAEANEKNDDQKIAMMSHNRNLVDF